MPGRRPLLATAVAAGAVALVLVAALALAGVLDENGERPPPGAIAQGDKRSVKLVERVRPGLVLVTARGPAGRGDGGSGFMVDGDGFIVTNQHLVAGARAVDVQAEGADGPIAAEVVGTDPATDVALLKVPRGDAVNLEPLRLGEDQSVVLGESVIAIGAPFALEGTVTAGIVSALDRQLESPSGFTIDGAIQTDAAIDDGNSGGPLIDADSKVIGLNTKARRSSGGIGFAIPIGTVREVLERIREVGDVETPFIGLTTSPVGPGLAQLLGLSVEHGLLIRAVAPGGPAAGTALRPFRPGRRPADVVVAIDGQAVREPRDVALAIMDRKAGDRITVQLVRGRRELRVRLTLARPPG